MHAQAQSQEMRSYQFDTDIVFQHLVVSHLGLQESFAIRIGREVSGNYGVERVQPRLVESRTHAGVVDEAEPTTLSRDRVNMPYARGSGMV